MRFLSPLRYPGGKSALAPFFSSIARQIPGTVESFVEPFAGGAGASLRLLVNGDVERIYLNDLNLGVFEFWRNVFERTEAFVKLINSVEVTIDEWYHQRDIYINTQGSELEIGFATFFLNRVNRSGILGARPIGGLDQAGRWKLNCRFNVSDLIRRVEYLSNYRERVNLVSKDAVEFLSSIECSKRRTIVYADPPYLRKDMGLYLDECTWSTHRKVAEQLEEDWHFWVVSYNDDEDRVTELYKSQQVARFALSHTAGRPQVGTELMVFSSDIVSHVDIGQLGRLGGVWLHEASNV